MIPEVQKLTEQVEVLTREVGELSQWVKERKQQQLAFPLDLSSVRALNEAFRAVQLSKIVLGSVNILYGAGAPTEIAGKGSLYLRTDGSSTSTRAYINTDSGSTWTAVTTAA